MELVEKPAAFAVRTTGLRKIYGGRACVDGLDLAFQPGELHALLGPNGAGKTTTIKMLCGLVKPDAGTLRIMDREVRGSAWDWKGLIAVSPQETAIAGHLTVRENLDLAGGLYGLGKAVRRQRIERLLDELDLGDRPSLKARKLSGGQQRRVSIAMALMPDTPVLFLDEPTLGLDPQARRDLWEKIRRLKGHKTILLTTHYLEEADALADAVSIIKDGRIIASGSPESLKQGVWNLRVMLVKTRGLRPETLDELRRTHDSVSLVPEGVEIRSKSLEFDGLVNFFRARNEAIDGIASKEPSLDDVFFQFATTEVQS